jgi:hypothetical protein
MMMSQLAIRQHNVSDYRFDFTFKADQLTMINLRASARMQKEIVVNDGRMAPQTAQNGHQKGYSDSRQNKQSQS